MRTVAVLRGGVGGEHEVSFKTGNTVLQHLGEQCKTTDIFIDRQGVWHVRGVPKEPVQALLGADVVFNALHGKYGEDGELQRILDRLNIPYTGSGALASALAMNKCATKELMQKNGIRMPQYTKLVVSPDLDAEIIKAFRSFPQPSIIKPSHSGSSVGVTLAKTFDEFKKGVKEAFQHSKEVLVEEFVKGKEATVGVIDAFREKEYYTLPPVEIMPKAGSAFFDYDAKYSSESEERCPGNFSNSEAEKLRNIAELVHRQLGLRHYSRSDFVVTPKDIYFLEVNTLPGLTEASLLPKSLGAVGVTLPQFLEHVIHLAESR